MIIIRNLSELEMKALDQTRKLAFRLMNVSKNFTAQDFDQAYADVLKNTADNVQFQNALGVAFGDMIISRSGYHWLRVRDEYGEETAVGLSGHKIVCHPISMIQKRLTSNESVDSSQLVTSTINAMQQMRTSGEYRSN